MRNAPKVLIVDDDKAFAQTLAEIVKRMGFKAVVTNKSVDALNVVRLQTVHAAIVDVLLPKMTGVELVEEFRKTKFGDNPVVFVSGVFKDRAFATETLRKTSALEFLFKPFENETLIELLNKSMADLLSAERWNVRTLLTRKLISNRDRAKAIENLEQIKGLDFPFVLSILMETGSSGHLNIVNEAGEIFGVSLVSGTIGEVDSTESQATGVLALISKGYLSQEDWDEFQRSGQRKFSLERLVQEGFVSPHAISDARKEQIIHDFRTICAAQTLQVNFVPQDDSDEPPRHAVRLQDMMELLQGSTDDFFPLSHLRETYEAVLQAPIRKLQDGNDLAAIFERIGCKDLVCLKTAVEKGGTLQEALAASGKSEIQVYQCLHFLVMNRAIMFDDLSRAKNLSATIERYKKLYGELQGKTPDKIFEYFGAASNASEAVIQNIYDEYVRSNNPETLGKDATPELRDLCKKCFDIVSKAHAVLADADAKQELMSEIKAKAAETAKQASILTNEGLELLRKGQPKEALERLRRAEKMGPSARLTFLGAWAELKAGPVKRERLQEIIRQIEHPPGEDKKSQYYFMAMGLAKRHTGDPTALAMFEKAVAIDSEFHEARRELMKLQNASNPKAGSTDTNILTGDITAIVSQLFRRKAE